MFKKSYNPKVKGEGDSFQKKSKAYPSKKTFYPASKPAGKKPGAKRPTNFRTKAY